MTEISKGPNISDLIDEFAKERLAVLDSSNLIYQTGAAQDLYPNMHWKQACQEYARNDSYIEIIVEALPAEPPKGRDGSLAFLAELESRLKQYNIQIHIVPKGYKDITYLSNGERQSVSFDLSAGRKALHFCPAEEKVISISNNGKTRKVVIAQKINTATSLLLINEEILEDPFTTVITVAHELGHEREFDRQKEVIDIEGKVYEKQSFYTEVMSTIFALTAAYQWFNKYGCTMNNLFEIATEVQLYNQVLNRN